MDIGALASEITETYPGLKPPQAQVTIAPDLQKVLGNKAALTQCLAHADA